MNLRVVLTADRTLMSDYLGGLFLGFMTTAPRRGFPLLHPIILFNFIARPVPVDGEGRAILAPHGLRRVEAALIESGVVAEDEVAVVPPNALPKAIGPETEVIGISTNDPLGLGPSSSTLAGPYGVIHEEPMTAWKFRELVTSRCIQEARRRGAKLVVGGPGAWQLGLREMRALGIDVVIDGEGEIVAPRVFKELMEGSLKTPCIVKVSPSEMPDPSKIPRLRGGTIGGLVEVSRGCGRGCQFCLPTMRRLRHRPIEDVLADVKVNVRCGKRAICLHAEDILRYGGTPLEPRPDRVVELFTKVSRMPEVEEVGISHAALSSIASSPKLVEEISEILELTERRWMGFQTGIETGSPRLMERLMKMKPYPFKPKDWPEVVEQAFAISVDNNWIPCATLIVNLPGETDNDVMDSVELVERLKPYRSLMVPLLYVPPPEFKGHRAMRLIEDASPYHLELYRVIMEHNLRWLVELADDYSRYLWPPARVFIRRLARAIKIYVSRKMTKAFKDWSATIHVARVEQVARRGVSLSP
ncbi:MAG: radical SAM protein [Thermoprotei archaeon]|nr:MAG: radical SAM protein [Thermoprotei archaeon]